MVQANEDNAVTGCELEVVEGYEPPTCRQFTLFLDQRVGQWHTLLEHLEEASIPLAAMSTSEASDYCVMRLITAETTALERLLSEWGYRFMASEILVVQLTGSNDLVELSRLLVSVELNVSYAYAVSGCGASCERAAGVWAIQVEDSVLAGQLLRRKGFQLLGQNDLK